MTLADVPWSEVLQGAYGSIALYLALQIRKVIQNHEGRITHLEGHLPKPKKRSRRGRI